MKAKKAPDLATTLLLPLLLLLTGCDRAETGLIIDPKVEGPYQIESFIPAGAQTAVFKTTGVIDDHGTMEGEPLPVDEDAGTWIVRYRMFHGEKGFIAVQVDARYAGAHLVEASYSVLGSNGAYATVQNQGSYHVRFDGKDAPVEYFSGQLY